MNKKTDLERSASVISYSKIRSWVFAKRRFSLPAPDKRDCRASVGECEPASLTSKRQILRWNFLTKTDYRGRHRLWQNFKNKKTDLERSVLVGEAGFGPAKSVTTDLQSAPFGRSGIPPGAGDRSRTNNLLITNQLLCH